MERQEALKRLKALIGCDLRVMADDYGIALYGESGKKNKGWAGHTVERHLGLPRNSLRAPNFGSWELKSVPLRTGSRTGLRVKETMAITMIDPEEVKLKSFEESHLFLKLRKMVVLAWEFEDQSEPRCLVRKVEPFDLDDPQVMAQVKRDYDDIRDCIINGIPLKGKMGILVQPRTKGAGRGSTSRAFYARTGFVADIIGLPRFAPRPGAPNFDDGRC